MPVKNSAVASGKMSRPAPRSAMSNSKHLAVKKSAAKKNVKGAGRPAKKARRHSTAFSTLSSRQQAVERAKLQVWRHLEEINGAVIKLAESGSYLAARTLFDFAGVYTLPPLEQETVASAVAAAPSAAAPSPGAPPSNRVEAFMKTLGLEELADDEPEPDVAA